MKKLFLIPQVIFLILIFNICLAEEITFWGPTKYLRTTGSPDNYTSVFLTTPGPGKLIVKNGALGGNNRVEDSLSSATISVNGEQIFGPSDFNKQIFLLEASLNLAENNEFFIELASSPGSYLTIEIVKDIDLPPDPGDAGKETLLGIDIDNDGVRDDIQRYIYITYPTEEKVRLALTQITKNYQELLPYSGIPELAHENVKKLTRSRVCLFFIKNDYRIAIDIRRALQAEILNTNERSTTYVKFENSLAGKTTTLPPDNEWKDCCLFDVDSVGGDQ